MKQKRFEDIISNEDYLNILFLTRRRSRSIPGLSENLKLPQDTIKRYVEDLFDLGLLKNGPMLVDKGGKAIRTYRVAFKNLEREGNGRSLKVQPIFFK